MDSPYKFMYEYEKNKVLNPLKKMWVLFIMFNTFFMLEEISFIKPNQRMRRVHFMASFYAHWVLIPSNF